MNQVSTTPTRPLTLVIEGMSCGHCVQAVTSSLSGLSSVRVRSVVVGSAEIEALSPDAASDAIRAIEDAGYTARVKADVPATAGTDRSEAGCCGGRPKGCCE